jgi:ATP-dependent RNA helicase DeaD
MVVFVRTRHGATELADKLKSHGFAADALHGDMDQQARQHTIERLKDGRLDIVVATDVAARGLDVERVTHVVNYDIPTDPQAYVHRVGRTGRAGRAGRAILLVEPRERGLLRSIERTIGAKVPEMSPPSAAELSASRIDRFTSDLRATLAGEDLDFFYRLVAGLEKEQELDLMDIAAALAFQLQRERPLEVTGDLRPPARRERDPRERPAARPERRGERDGERRFEPRGERRPRRFDDRGADDAERRRPEPRSDRARGADTDLTRYRIEVGHAHGVTPREIVGAIANESGLEGRYIGRIDIGEDHSIVDLPSGMPNEVFQHLKGVYVRGQALRISRAGAGDGGRPRHQDGDDRARRGRPRPRDDERGGPPRRGDGFKPKRRS